LTVALSALRTSKSSAAQSSNKSSGKKRSTPDA
jgi:hypothetical protein